MVNISKLIQHYTDLDQEYGASNYNPIPVVISRGKGVWVWDINNKKYLDCLAAYSALNFGHLHPKIVKAVKEQISQLTLTSRAYHNDKLGLFLRELCEFSNMDKALPMNTGAEAVETGIKIARRWGYQKRKVEKNKAEIIVCENNFHGRTTTISGFSSNLNSYNNFGPPTPGFIKIPFNDTEALKKSVNKNTVGFLVEPVQGEAGVIIPDKGYLKAIRDICEDNKVLLILDEIQTGLGRTGRNFAFESESIRPDILLLGKALGGGVYPVSAALAVDDIMDVMDPGSHGSTFGGNPLAAAVGLTSLKLLQSKNLSQKANKSGIYFLNRLKELYSEKIKDIRGIGLMIAIEFKRELVKSREIVLELMKNGLLTKDTHRKTIRITPPLIIEKKELDYALNVIKHVII
ncbi:MAG: ornithine--oxo-acid transaminase [Candidatus Lokiarchaeota archaeon]|nr:ornithine--oxo-acid transaminase [Candidatus Lokiarchaeota archaeon]